MLVEENSVKYTILVDGKVHKSNLSKMSAELLVAKLNEENEDLLVEMVPVTDDGKQILFG